MMQRSGYMQVSGAPAYDPLGNKCRIFEISVGAGRYAIETNELSMLLLYGKKCRISHLTQHFGKHIGDYAGTISLSYSKKGLIIEIISGRRYIASRNSAAGLLKGYTRYIALSEIQTDAENRINSCNNPTVQSTITPWVAV